MGVLLLVGVGGFLGSVARHLMTEAAHAWIDRDQFPVGTLIVNVLGCLVIGLAAQFADARGALSAETRAFLVVGILGGFTTFSSFGNETMNLWRDGKHLAASANILLQVVLGLAAVGLGRVLGHRLWG